MASGACQRGMHARQREAGIFQVIEFHVEPSVHVVTFLTGSRKSGAHVSWSGSLLEILRVARVARGRHRAVITDRAILVARIAIQHGVRPHQRKAVVVVLDRLDGNIPSIHRVALLATRAHLGTVDIGVTLGALRAHIRKYRLDVALGAHHPLVHAPQGEVGLVVIKLWYTADRLPSQRGVTIRTGQV